MLIYKPTSMGVAPTIHPDLQYLSLYQHVKECITAICDYQFDRGRCVVPTGGGKTAIEAYSLMLKGFSKDFKVHLVLAPRIVLLNQLIKEYRKYIGNGYLAMCFHSGKLEQDYQEVKWEETATTSTDVIASQIIRAQAMGRNLVIFSTYHSAWKLVDMHFGMIIADESQYCVSENYFETITNLRAEFKLFCTATEKHISTTNLGRGLNNETVFGPVIPGASVPAATLIERGIIVPPRVHIMSGTKASQNRSASTVVDETIRIAKHQHQLTIADGMPYSKILFAMDGTDDIRKIIASIAQIKQALPTHRIFTIMSNEKYGAMIDGSKTICVTQGNQVWQNKISRGTFFKELRETDNALIFHYDIISEGIDIDGITGVVINRNMTLSKLLQTIGRAVRIFKAAPHLKPQAWVTVPVINGDVENEAWVKSVLSDIRTSFDIRAEEIKFTSDEGPGVDDDEGLGNMFSNPNLKTLQTKITNVLHEIEDGLYWKKLDEMTPDELIEWALQGTKTLQRTEVDQ